MFNALMPGEHNYQMGRKMPGQGRVTSEPLGPVGAPAMMTEAELLSMQGPGATPRQPAPMQAKPKKNRPILNALGSYFQFAAPEEYQAGRMARMNKDYGNALASGDMEKAAQYRLQMGDFEGAQQIQQYTAGQQEAARKQEAQGVYQLFSQMDPVQINEMVMSNPAVFEQYTGMSSDEYNQIAQTLTQAGMRPEQIHQFVLQKAQAELGIESKPTEYGLDLVPVQGPDGKTQYVQASKAGGVRPVEGFTPVPETGEAFTLSAGEIRYNPDGTVAARGPAKPVENTRKTAEDQNGVLRYLDTGEAVFPNVETGPNAANRKTAEDQNGVLRYIDTGEPVFPSVKTAPATPKPLIGSEAMARVAAGLPVAKQAVTGLRSLLQNSKGTGLLSMEGYSPGRDWGAGLVQDVGHIPVVGGLVRPATEALSRTIGGEDYQKFEDSYSAYEAAILPIMSGAAVTDTEALRQLRAVRIKPGDSKATQERKLQAMEMQIQGLEMAARGDVSGFLGMLDQAGAITGTGPVKRRGAAATTGLENASDDDLFKMMRGE